MTPCSCLAKTLICYAPHNLPATTCKEQSLPKFWAEYLAFGQTRFVRRQEDTAVANSEHPEAFTAVMNELICSRTH